MFFFAWVDQGTSWSTDLEREDEKVFSFELTHSENDFPALSITVRNPRVGLLAPGRKQWAWLSWSPESGDALPLFYGQLVKIPAQLQGELVQLSLLARPVDFNQQKAALAATLAVLPYYDPIWYTDDARANSDTVLEGRAALWHIDRLTHVVTVSDIIQGEDSAIDLTSADIFYNSLSVNYGEVPARKVSVKASVGYKQTGIGSLNITAQIWNAYGGITWTADGLISDWPQPGDSIGAGWSFGAGTGASIILEADAKWVSWAVYGEPIPGQVGISAPYYPLTGSYGCWFKEHIIWPATVIDYSVERDRKETVTFDLYSDVQTLVTAPGEDEFMDISLSSDLVSAAVDTGGAIPIGDLRRPSYFKTDRGKQSIVNLILQARARLLARARTVNIKVDLPFEMAIDLSCRKNAIIHDDRLPGGIAIGKITDYSLSGDGDTGEIIASLTIGCAVGHGNGVVASAGEESYVEEDYIDATYQFYTGSSSAAATNDVVLDDFDDFTIADDGVDFFNMIPSNVILSLSVANNYIQQGSIIGAVASGDWPEWLPRVSPPSILKDYPTQISLSLKPLTGSFDLTIPLDVSLLMVPKMIDLEAAS